jgi:DNA-binding LacI/PurR family transcriptional regulator
MTTAVPEYARIKRSLVAEIEAGRWPRGGAIPSESQLAAKHGVSRATVVRSLQELALEGYLLRHKGRGTFVADFKNQLTGDRKPAIPLFIYEGTYRMSGSGRQVLLRILAGIEDALGPSHPGVSVRQTSNTLDDNTRRAIDRSRPRVALVIEPSFNRELVNYLQDAGCVTWVINEPVDTSNCVYINQERAGYLATQHLLADGRKRIALLNGPMDLYWGFGARYRGYAAALAEAGIALDPALHRQAAHSIDSEAGRGMLRALINEKVAFDGVVGVSDSKAMGAMALAEELGIAMPDDVLFVSIDNTIADQSERPLSSVAMPFEEIGRKVAQEALEAENQPPALPDSPRPLQHICLQPYLVHRPSNSENKLTQPLRATVSTSETLKEILS